MEQENRRKIKETVIDILNKSNMEDATELKARAEAGKRLGMDLSVSPLVSQVFKDYFISRKAKEGEAESRETVSKEFDGDGDPVIFQLSNDGSIKVHELEGRTLVSIKQCNEGISLTTDEWSTVRDSIPAIDEAILQMRRKSKRSEYDANKLDAVSTPTGITPKFSFRAIRFEGKNFRAWASQMKSLLQYLKIAYVLFDHVPNAVLGPESGSRNPEQERKSDDHVCRHIILSSLSKFYFQKYIGRTMSAKELWKDINTLFNYRTKRSQVEKYVGFMMVEERPLSKQIEELDNIAKSIVSAGLPIDQEFHHSVIVSKLPPSWRNAKWMHEEHLSSVALIDRLRAEEQLRTQQNSHIAGGSRNQGGQPSGSTHIKDGKPKSQSLV